jgi:DNA-binding Lrp family transcriptional regulator
VRRRFSLPDQEAVLVTAETLDEQDRVLINLLQANARATYQELACATGMSPSTVRRRVERLLDTGALKLVAVPDWAKLGIFFGAFLAISVDLPHLRNVGNELARMDEICFVAIATGSYDLFAQVVLPMNGDFVRFVTQRVAPITGIRDIETFMIPEYIKSFEEYRLPPAPNPLYVRGGNGNYAFSEELAAGR